MEIEGREAGQSTGKPEAGRHPFAHKPQMCSKTLHRNILVTTELHGIQGWV